MTAEGTQHGRAAGAVERHCPVPRRGLGLTRLLTKAALKLKRLSWAG